MRKLASSLVIIALAVIAMAGCGSNGTNSSLTKTEFVRKGNAICGRWQQAREERYTKISQKASSLTKKAQQEKALLYLLSPYETAIAGLTDLPPPAGEERKVEVLIKAMEEAMTDFKHGPILSGKGSPFLKSNKMAEKYGLKECTA